jgi:arylsulfatase A-like enzyme
MVARLYAAGVREMDGWLGRLLAEIDAHPSLAARTTLVVTSDHGEELLEHGHVGHASTSHHAQLHDEVLRIPLLVIDPRVAGLRRIDTRVQRLDLFKTLLSLAGVSAPSGGPGVDLAPFVTGGAAPPIDGGRPFYFQSSRMGYQTPRAFDGHEVEAVSWPTRKIVAERFDAPRAMLYDLARDPGERAPETAGQAVRAALEELEAVRRSLERA